MNRKELLISWLNDAHGMENSLIKILEHQVKDARDHPPVQARLEQHLEQTKRHAQMTKECVEALGGHTSALKTGLATLFGQIQAPSTGAAKDEMVKNALTDYAAENFEIASYTALIRAAQDLNETHIATVCQQILQDEQAMADWIKQNLPSLVQQTWQEVTV